MIREIYINNYKCLVNFKLELEELSLLLGPSGVGKTAVLDVVFALRRLLSGDARLTDADVFPTRTLTRWQSRNLQVFEMQVLLESETYTYRLEVEHQRETRLARIGREWLNVDGTTLFECTHSEVQLYRDDPDDGVTKGPSYTADWRESALARVAPVHHNQRLTRFLDYMRNMLVCGIRPLGLKAEAATESPLLDRDAGNFADWFRHMLQEHPEMISDLKSALTEVIGAGFNGIRLERVSHEVRVLMASFDQEASNSKLSYELRFDEMSDGQRALVILYGLIHLTQSQGYTLLIDEPENYVALREIQPWLMSLEDASGDTLPQAVIVSHHPEMIDYLGREYGILLQRETSGVITARRLDTRSETDGGVELSELVERQGAAPPRFQGARRSTGA